MTKKQIKMITRIIVSAVSCVAAFLITHFVSMAWYWRLAIFSVPYLIIGYDILIVAIRNILHGHIFDEEFLMVIATIGAFAVGEYPEAAGVMIFYQIGELFQGIAVGKSRKSIAAMMDIRPDFAVVVRDDKEETVSPDEVQVGEIIVIKPGEKIPLDGEVIDGSTSVNTAALTGESLPVDKMIGDKVVSGSINLTGVIRVRSESLFEESTVSKILELVENSASKKARVENFITRFAKYYTPCVVVSAVLIAFVPPLLFSQDWSSWINRALIFLMVSCPCALVVSVPMSFFGGIGGASREGILIKGANYMEALAKIDTVVFDKTGTLTRGTFAVDAIHPTDITAAELLDIAAEAESYSTHPVGASIVAAHKGHLSRERVGEITEIAGKGLEAIVDGTTYYVGNGALMDMAGADWHPCHLTGTVIHISRDNQYLGHIVINDEIKADAKQAIADLKAVGILKTMMLTGDTDKVAFTVKEKVGVDDYRADLLPVQKVEEVEKLLANGSKLAFVGDGINDAPVLSRADVGIAMGALGSDAAIESADIVLMDDKPTKIGHAIRIARKTMKIVKQNIWFALGVKAIILVLAAFGLTNMWVAIFGDVGVMVLAVINSMRAMMKTK